ncbi:hypothetical protein GJU40_08850 [Bacillus lacus]|uniref:Uncharacterized protein n=1 Tax=Metabacillus lacus TaxID=1983721 RepID=A0A7X2IYQ4_9BACI|nr:hypothetical protein [Metabacillus lacus]MRX72258.1 hypothetical protein [Metabacillus lacus]
MSFITAMKDIYGWNSCRNVLHNGDEGHLRLDAAEMSFITAMKDIYGWNSCRNVLHKGNEGHLEPE